jgi:hypothetical protein
MLLDFAGQSLCGLGEHARPRAWRRAPRAALGFQQLHRRGADEHGRGLRLVEPTARRAAVLPGTGRTARSSQPGKCLFANGHWYHISAGAWVGRTTKRTRLVEKKNAGRGSPAWRGGSPRRLNWGGMTYGLIAICPYVVGVSGSTCASRVVADAPSAKRVFLTLGQWSNRVRGLLRAEGADAEEVLVAGEVDFDGHGFGRNVLSSCFAEGQ